MEGNTLIHGAKKKIDGLYKIGEENKDAIIEIRGEVYDRPLHNGGDRDPIHSRVVIGMYIDGYPDQLIGLCYYPGQLTETEMKAEVEGWSVNPDPILFEDVVKKIKLKQNGHSKEQ